MNAGACRERNWHKEMDSYSVHAGSSLPFLAASHLANVPSSFATIHPTAARWNGCRVADSRSGCADIGAAGEGFAASRHARTVKSSASLPSSSTSASVPLVEEVLLLLLLLLLVVEVEVLSHGVP